MTDLGQQVGLFIISWVFWFIILYVFVYFREKKPGKTQEAWERIFLIGKVSLLCAAANTAVSIGVRMYHAIYA